jgi:WD40 repeat protein
MGSITALALSPGIPEMLQGDSSLPREDAVTYLASGSTDHRVKLWNAEQLETGSIDELYGHHDLVTSLAFSPKSASYLACAITRGTAACLVVWWLQPASRTMFLRPQVWTEAARRPLEVLTYPGPESGPERSSSNSPIKQTVPEGFSRREF